MCICWKNNKSSIEKEFETVSNAWKECFFDTPIHKNHVKTACTNKLRLKKIINLGYGILIMSKDDIVDNTNAFKLTLFNRIP